MSYESIATKRDDNLVSSFPNPESLARLGEWMASSLISQAHVKAATRLTGGAIQENWRLDMSDGRSFVLRTDADAAIPSSCTRSEEYARYRLAFDHGVRVACPHGLCEDLTVTGKPFFILAFVTGVTAGHRLTKDAVLVPDRHALARDLGEIIGSVHRVPAAAVRSVAGSPPALPVAAAIDRLRCELDVLPHANPALELCLRELELRIGHEKEAAFSHGDYRTGNYMVSDGKVSAVLDWEFAGWGHPYEDLGWFTAPCWRFGHLQRLAGGIGPLEDFLDGYRETTGRHVNPDELVGWQALAQIKWAVIALHQENRHLSGAQRSLELALSGRLVAGLTVEAMNLLGVR
jgi:aminoglycoside phosphotransferase (APT) family kinase protein